MSILPSSQHPFRRAQVWLPFRPSGAFIVGLAYYALLIIFSASLGVSLRSVVVDTTRVTMAFLLAFSIPAGVSVLDDIDKAFASIDKHVPDDHYAALEKWLREFSTIQQARSKGAVTLYVVGSILTTALAAYLLFLNPYVHQRVFDLYSRRGIEDPKASAFLLFDFLTFFLPMSVIFVLALGVWLSGITWLVLRVDDREYPYAVGRTWPASASWRKALSPIVMRIVGKPWIGGTIQVEPNPYHYDRHGGLKSVIDVHFRAMIIIAIALGALAALVLQGLPLLDTFIILLSIGSIIFITFFLITNSARKFLTTLRQREFSAWESRILTLGRELSRRDEGSIEELLRDIREVDMLRFLVGEVEKIPTWPIGLSRSAFTIVTPVIVFVIERYLAALLQLTP